MRLQKWRESVEEDQSKQRCHPVVDWGKTQIKYLQSASLLCNALSEILKATSVRVNTPLGLFFLAKATNFHFFFCLYKCISEEKF